MIEQSEIDYRTITAYTNENGDRIYIFGHQLPEFDNTFSSRVLYIDPEDGRVPAAYRPLTTALGEFMHRSSLIRLANSAGGVTILCLPNGRSLPLPDTKELDDVVKEFAEKYDFVVFRPLN